jgi:PPOX class probable FMN-dependent enzyme
MSENTDDYIIGSEAELASILGEPSELVRQKVCDRLDEAMCEFIRRSPLVFYATLDPSGLPDVSPKGDAPGFVHVDDQGRLLIPERPGNRLAFGFRNLLRNPAVGLIFVVPTMRETLRIKGRAVVSRDPGLLQRLQARGKPALLCTRVEVTECFFHCGKAMIRSNMWKPENWIAYSDSLIVRQVAGLLGGGEAEEQLVDEALAASYRDTLY